MLRKNKTLFIFNFPLLIFLFVNVIFILRYGSRQPFISEYVISFIYVSCILICLFFLEKNKQKINSITQFNSYFLFFIVILFLIFILINIVIDSSNLNVDRWSAMHITIENMLKGVYPYNQLDHLGQTSSNLPGLSYIGLPFYFMGDVGLLQPFVFLLFFIWLLKTNRQHKTKLTILILFILSPSFLWEVFVKSDLMSNVLLLILFISTWKEKIKSQKTNTIILSTLLITLLILTRGIVLIPLLLIFFSVFIESTIHYKLKFIFFSFFWITLLIVPILFSIDNISIAIEHNPFTHQTKYAPKILIIISLITPLFLSRKNLTINNTYKYSLYIIFFLVFITFLLNILEEGVAKNIYGTVFDLSYLSMVLPFSILLITKQSISKY